MSKPLAAFYGQKSIRQSPQPKPQEYTVLGVNQPLVAPEPDRLPESWPLALPTASGQHKFRLTLLLNKLV
ncbi:MAG: hypothetical protein IPM53_17075 [Anaerolineaceae bacterium]|nr:hypothetical protein [Anaerolineaceae bacterium]